jgi:hypothetical protein
MCVTRWMSFEIPVIVVSSPFIILSNQTQFQLTFPLNIALDAGVGAIMIIFLLHISCFV